MQARVITFALLLAACGSDTAEPADGGDLDGTDSDGGDLDGTDSADANADPETTQTMVSWVVYTNPECSGPGRDVVTVDTALACNPSGDGSVSDVVCHDDRITYTNHPNNADCSSGGVANTLMVGVCQEFPGPFATWKWIDPTTYHCASR